MITVNLNSSISEHDDFTTILCVVSKAELHLLFRLFQNLKDRTIEDGIDKATFHHFCQLPVRILTESESLKPNHDVQNRACGAKGFGPSL